MIKQNLPNAITMVNALLGCCAVIYFVQHEFTMGVLFTVGALMADFLDGFLARLLKVQSDLGGQLDSLADAISFGVAPACIAREVLLKTVSNQTYDVVFTIFASAIAAFSVLRLARFNVEITDGSYFIGLATPANTIFWLGVAVAQANSFSVVGQFANNTFAISTSVVLSCLFLVSRIQMFSFKNFSLLSKNRIFWVWLIGSMSFLIFRSIDFLVVTVVLYVIVNLFENIFPGLCK